MKRVSVVFTVHKEKGLADASRLLAILEHIDPEVIFLECADGGLEDYLNGTTHPLEAAAVARYRAIHRIDLIPVDIPIAAQDYLRNIQELSEAIDSPDNDCRRLITWDSNYIRDLGFAYLNSEHCSALHSQLHDATLAALAKLADHSLTERYELWIRTDERRDRAMMKNIESYSQHAAFSRALFLVGAAHRRSIIDLSRTEPGDVSSMIQWDFSLGEPNV